MKYLLFMFILTSSGHPLPPVLISEFTIGGMPAPQRVVDAAKKRCEEDGSTIAQQWNLARAGLIHVPSCVLIHEH